MNPYIIGTILGTIALSRFKGSRNAVKMIDESDLIITPENANLLATAKINARNRFLALKELQTVGLSNRTQIRFAFQEWQYKNPLIKFGSDLLFVKSLDDFGEVILFSLLTQDEKQRSLSSLIDKPETILSLIREKYYDFNVPVGRINININKLKLNTKQKAKLSQLKQNAILNLNGIAPYGEIAFLEYYNIPYKIDFKDAKIVSLWGQD